LIGGRDTDYYLNAICPSKDGNWIKQNNTNFPQRAGFSSVMSYSFLRIYGGYDGSNYYNDKCYSIINPSDDIGAPGRDNLFGHGRINMCRALAGLPGIRVSHRKMIIA